MIATRNCITATLIMGLSLALLPRVLHAAVTSVVSSNVDSYFGALNDFNQQSSPGAPFSSWTPVSTGGPPPYGNFLPNVPITTAGSTLSSTYSAAGNTATSNIGAYISGVSSLTQDANVAFNASLIQSGSTYAYEQVDYQFDYGLTNTANAAFPSVGVFDSIVNRSYLVSGSVGTYVQFGGQMTYWQTVGGVNTTNLGTLTFSYFNNTPGAFSTIVGSSSLIGSGLPINAPDGLRVVGDFYVIGDPSTINVVSIPEPTSFALAALGFVAVAAWRLRRR